MHGEGDDVPQCKLIFGQSFEEDEGDQFRDSIADQFQSEDMSTEQDVGDGAAEGAEEQPHCRKPCWRGARILIYVQGSLQVTLNPNLQAASTDNKHIVALYS
jgi:hypothetical protein